MIKKYFDKFGFEEIRKRHEELPTGLKDLLDGEIGGVLIVGLAEKYGLDPKNSLDLMMLFGFYVTRLISGQDLVNELARLIPEKYFNQFMIELESKVWLTYEASLNKAEIIFKQLKLLEPKPIEEESVPPVSQMTSVPATSTGFEIPQVVPQTKPVPASYQSQVQSRPMVIGEKPVLDSLAATSSELPKASVPETIKPQTSIKPPEPELRKIDALKVPMPEIQASPPSQKQSTPFVFSDKKEARIGAVGEEKPFFIPKPQSAGLAPEVKEVKFETPQVVPEFLSSVSTKTEEKKIEIPKAPEVQKTDVSGKQVIDLTNFGSS